MLSMVSTNLYHKSDQHNDLMELLLLNNNGETALSYAVSHGAYDSVFFLVKWIACRNSPTRATHPTRPPPPFGYCCAGKYCKVRSGELDEDCFVNGNPADPWLRNLCSRCNKVYHGLQCAGVTKVGKGKRGTVLFPVTCLKCFHERESEYFTKTVSMVLDP